VTGSGGARGGAGSGGVVTTIGGGGGVTRVVVGTGAGGWAAGTVADALEAVGRATERAAAACLPRRSCFFAAAFVPSVALLALAATWCLATVLTACGRAAASDALTA
jgi:hypothetical protein